MRRTVRPTEIEWATDAWSPVVGCLGPTGTPDAPARCPGCYAHSYCRRFGASLGCQQCANFAPHVHENEFPALWPKRPSVVFVGPRTDLWSAGVPQEWRDRVFSQLRGAQERAVPMDAVVLTKRPQEFTEDDCEWFQELSHLWVGVSVTGPEDAWRYQALCDAVPAGRRVLSIEPLLSAANIPGSVTVPDWLIIGPLTPVRKPDEELGTRTARIIRDAKALGSAVFVKRAAEKAWPGVPLVQKWPNAMYYKPEQGGRP